MDSFATNEGAVALENNRASTRSSRKSKSRVPTPRKLTESFTSRIPSKKLGEGILDAHKEFLKDSPTFFNYWKSENIPKNRKQDVCLLYDWNRVVLNGDSDYYHASYVDGYCTKKQYILAQAPFDHATQIDFFRMVSQTHPEAIVLMDAPNSEDAKFMFPQSGTFGSTSVSTESGNESDGIAVQNYIINKAKIKAYCITGWNTDKEPPSGIIAVHEKIRTAIGLNNKATMLLVCKDGCSRSPLFCLIDIEAERLRSKGRIKFSESVRQIRYQRSNAFDTQELFDAASSVIVELAKKNIDICPKSEIKTV
ncbi:hypothetical protein Q1695_012738 [Nippostrongylus brasiliensis]|nr:hypothetical protein Q1695_012738 [Nippostrongylus brasiliensis]